MIFDDNCTDFNTELDNLVQQRRRKIYLEPQPPSSKKGKGGSGVIIESVQNEDAAKPKAASLRKKPDDPDYKDDDSLVIGDVHWEKDPDIDPSTANPRTDRRAFQYFWIGRPSYNPTDKTLEELDEKLLDYEKWERRNSKRSAKKTEQPALPDIRYLPQSNVTLTIPLKYVGSPSSKSPHPRCAWCIVHFLTECASGTPETISIAKTFINARGERDKFKWKFINRALNYKGRHEGKSHDDRVHLLCKTKHWDPQVSNTHTHTHTRTHMHARGRPRTQVHMHALFNRI